MTTATKLTTKFGVFDLQISDAEIAYVGLPMHVHRTVFGVDYKFSLHLKWLEGWSDKGDGRRVKQWTIVHFYSSRKESSLKHATPAANSAVRKAVLAAFTEMVAQHPTLLRDADLSSQLAAVERASRELAEARIALADQETALVEQIEAYAKAAHVDSATLIKQYAV